MNNFPNTPLKFLTFICNHKKINIIFIFILSIFIAFLITFDAYVIKLFIDSIVSSELTTKLIIIYGVLFFLRAEIFNISFRLLDFVYTNTIPALRVFSINKVTNYVSEHSYKYYQNNFAGSISSKISDLSSGIRNILVTLVRMFETTFLIIFSVFFLSKVSIYLGFSVIVFLIVISYANYFFFSKSIKLSKEFAENRATVFGKLVDFIGNINNVRYFSNKKFEMNYLDKYLNITKDSDVRVKKYFLKINYLKGLIISFLMTAIIVFSALAYKEGKLTSGDFYLIFAIAIKIIDRVWDMFDLVAQILEEWGVMGQGLKTLIQQYDIVDAENAKELNIDNSDIEFKNVKFKYLKDIPLFDGLSLKIESGKKVGLVGFSGSGKSSFVNLVIRLFDVNEGQILINGQNIAKVTQESLRSKIAFIPQEPMLFHRTLMENIRYGDLSASDEQVIEAAKLANAHDFITSTEHGYNSLVGERGIKLSGGQRQRIAIARAILKNAPILILDEATSSLDSVTEKEIQESLDKLMENRTTIVIAHRLSTLLNMDRIIVFDKGKIVEDGNFEELLNANGLFTKLWNSQVNGFIP